MENFEDTEKINKKQILKYIVHICRVSSTKLVEGWSLLISSCLVLIHANYLVKRN